MTYKETIKQECEEYAKDPMVRFIGYNTVFGSRMYGTLSGIDFKQCIESPVAENLMVGLAMGMALEGFKPVVCFERHDFILLALDAIVNHVDKLPDISGDQFKFPIIIRAIVGSRIPMDPGVQHRQSYTAALSHMLKNTDLCLPASKYAFKHAWTSVDKSKSGAVIIVEHKDDYDKELPETLL